jgi:hypothetical protein
MTSRESDLGNLVQAAGAEQDATAKADGDPPPVIPC